MYLSSIFLSMGTTVAPFALSGKVDEVILLHMAIDNGLEDFNIFSTSSEVTRILRQKSLWKKDLEFTSDLILQMLGWFL